MVRRLLRLLSMNTSFPHLLKLFSGSLDAHTTVFAIVLARRHKDRRAVVTCASLRIGRNKRPVHTRRRFLFSLMPSLKK